MNKKTPTPIQHFQKTKNVLVGLKKNIWCWFSGNKKDKATFEDKLKKLGYTISENKDQIYYEPKNENDRV